MEKNGEVTIYYPNGNVMSRKTLKKGVPHGKCITYYESGMVKCKRNYAEGLKEGERFKYE